MQKKMEKTANRSSADKDTNSSSSSSNFIIIIFAASLAAILYYEKDVLTELLGLGPGRNPAGNPPISKQGRTLNRNTLKSDIATETEGKIIVGGFDLAMELFIDGKKQDFIGKPLTVALNKEVTFTVKKPGYASYVTQINLNKEKNSIVLTIPELKKAGVGLLTTSQNYTAGSKLVYEEDGVMIEADLPFTDKRIPQGTYQAKVINPILGTEKKVEFKIEENKKHFLE
jgi:hypothetical protein